ncbi:MAG: nuclear transport factor 2 family protein [Novosphingobium sp.]|uniref:nuclear transport factor 2 family protein n=1 Tax=Novosphingobium sp. TaxID=1874826 RepID=UPI0032B7621A
MNAIAQVRQRERALRAAMLASDVAALDRLIEDDLLFVTPDGTLITKAQDLATHEAGSLRLDRMDCGESTCRMIGAAVLSITAAELAGSFAGNPFAGRFVYSRLWLYSEGGWRVGAGHASAIAAS